MAAAADDTKEPYPGAQKFVDVEAAPLNEREQKVWDAMQSRLADKGVDKCPKTMLLRFIRGYATEEDPLEAAIERLTACLEWREKLGVDKILDLQLEKEALFNKCWSVGLHGVGKMGRPVYIERLGEMDPAPLLENFTIDEITTFHVRMMERITNSKEAISATLGRPVYKHIVIIDLNGFGSKHMGKAFYEPVKQMINIDQHFYPESLYKMVIANAPWVFRAAWTMVKPFIHPLTKERIKMGNEHLLEIIDEEQLPQFLGGKCKCKDGKCLIEQIGRAHV